MSRGGLSTKLIQINLEDLLKRKMNVNQYLSLMKLYMWINENETLPIIVHEEDVEWLVKEGYIIDEKEEITFTEKGNSIFEPKGDLFLEFFEKYPSKVRGPDGHWRILGTANVNTIFGAKMRKKWNNATKGNIVLQRTIIKGLENELKYKKRTNSSAYMQNMETWLNNGTWEKFQDTEEDNEEKNVGKIL